MRNLLRNIHKTGCNNICYVYGAGEHFCAPVDICPGDIIIAADGGVDFLNGHNVRPHMIIGDFDSCSAVPENGIVLPREKDYTDMLAALNAGIENGYNIFHIYGGTGGRIDHTLANIQCVAHLAEKGGRGFLFAEKQVITAIHNGAARFNAQAFGYISVFAHGDSARGVFETGLKYMLKDAVLYNTNPLGVSNEFIGRYADITVRDGTIILIYDNRIKEADL